MLEYIEEKKEFKSILKSYLENVNDENILK